MSNDNVNDLVSNPIDDPTSAQTKLDKIKNEDNICGCDKNKIYLKYIKIITAFFIGLNSGIIYALLTSTTTVYLQDVGVSIVMIGMLSLRTLPYAYKYMYAPFFSHFKSFFFCKHGLYKDWMMLSSACTIACIFAMAFVDPQQHLTLFCVLTVFAAFCASACDIASDGYRISVMAANDSAVMAQTIVAQLSIGFRFGLIISAAFALYLSSVWPWRYVFLFLGGCMIPGIIVLSRCGVTKQRERFITTNVVDISETCDNVQYNINGVVDIGDKINEINNEAKVNKKPFLHILRIMHIMNAFKIFKIFFVLEVITPLRALFSKKNFFAIAIIISLYRISDGYIDAMMMPFLMEIGFSKTDIATAVKTVGIISSLIGAFVASQYMKRVGMIIGLFVSETLAICTNLLFALLAYNGRDVILLAFINVAEHLCGSMSNVAFLCYISSLCDIKFSAMQFSILYSTSYLIRSLIASTSGVMAKKLGWQMFFVFSTIFSIPSLLLIYFVYIKKGTHTHVYNRLVA